MARLTTIVLLVLYLTCNIHAEDITGKCPLATTLFHSKSAKGETEQISQSTMCPKIKNSCCDESTFRAMNVWWDDDEQMSMNRLWLDKIQRIYKEMRLMNDVYFPKVVKWMKVYKNSKQSNIQCKGLVNYVQRVWDVEAFSNLFYVFPISSQKCWQYSINFMRGLACGICDSSSTFFYTRQSFILNPSECYLFTDACTNHSKAFMAFFEYTRWMSGIASCKAKNKIRLEEELVLLFRR